MSERAVQGVIREVNSRDFQDRNSGEPIKLFSFQLENSNQWFRTGRMPLPFGRGDTISFVADGQNVNAKSAQKVQAAVAVAAPVSQATTAPTSASARTESTVGSTNKDDYWSNKESRDLDKDVRYREVSEPRMALSVATEAAAMIVAAAFTADALGFGNAAKAKKLGMIVDATKEVARELALFIHNAPEELKAAKSELVREQPQGVEQENNE